MPQPTGMPDLLETFDEPTPTLVARTVHPALHRVLAEIRNTPAADQWASFDNSERRAKAINKDR